MRALMISKITEHAKTRYTRIFKKIRFKTIISSIKINNYFTNKYTIVSINFRKNEIKM